MVILLPVLGRSIYSCSCTSYSDKVCRNGEQSPLFSIMMGRLMGCDNNISYFGKLTNLIKPNSGSGVGIWTDSEGLLAGAFPLLSWKRWPGDWDQRDWVFDLLMKWKYSITSKWDSLAYLVFSQSHSGSFCLDLIQIPISRALLRIPIAWEFALTQLEFRCWQWWKVA